MLTVTKTDKGVLRVTVDAQSGGGLEADVTVTQHRDGVQVEFEFPDIRLRTVIARASAKALATALLAALVER